MHDRAFGGDSPRECDNCGGTGEVENETCVDCKGTGYELVFDPRDTDDAYDESVDDEMGCV
jgi:DnaJ-class molecular chaperone